MTARGAAALGLLLLASCAPARERPNLLVVTLDTTRADHLGCYGRLGARTDNLDRLAAEGTLFLSCSTAVPVTTPSHSTIFTGTYPLFHGVRDNGIFALPDAATTLAEMLKGQGYATGAAIGSFPLTRQFGIDQGFDSYDDHVTVSEEDFRGLRVEEESHMYFDERHGAQVNDAILPWLRGNAKRPFFAWIHYWDAHFPHRPPPPFSELYAHDPYQGEIAYADRCLGVVLEELRSLGVLDRTIVVVVGDHGEGRGDHGELTHSMLNYDATLRVPFIVRVPGEKGGVRVGQHVGTVDVVPTLLELLGLPAAPDAQGRSLVPLMRGGSATPVDYYAETLAPRLSYGWGELRTIYRGPFKYVHGPRPELYRIADDPEEATELHGEMADEAVAMKRALAHFIGSRAGKSAADAVHDLPADAREQLEALGYLSGSGGDPTHVREELHDGGTPPQERVGDVNLTSRTKQALEEKDFLSAKEFALKLVARDPDNPYYCGLLAHAYVGLGQIERAADAIERPAFLAAPNSAIALFVARRMFALGMRERAYAIAERLAREHPTANAHNLLAEMQAQRGEAEASLESLRAAVKADPKLAPARLSLGVQLAEADRTEEAEKELRALLAAHPRHARGALNLGILLLKTERFEEGMAQVRFAIEIKPDYWEAHLALLAAHVDLGERAEAEEIMERLRAGCQDGPLLAHAERLLAPS